MTTTEIVIAPVVPVQVEVTGVVPPCDPATPIVLNPCKQGEQGPAGNPSPPAWYMRGVLVATPGTFKWCTPEDRTIRWVILTLLIAGQVTVDVNIDGVSMFAPGSEPTITSGTVLMVPVNVAWLAGSCLTVDTDAVDGVASDLTVQVMTA